ncbi:hypothetical protein DNTS_021427 [Danionella cerebrum]|uniref:Endosome-associated-trafficking regulator 1 n=1 Tax=Danionella cerebrum TaxID=2873325 RepID=A0A553R149_9TELE|nr:hypothetical protein DNTS_021427 [Danionella translucida]
MFDVFYLKEFCGPSFIEQDYTSSIDFSTSRPFFNDPTELCQPPESKADENWSESQHPLALEGSHVFDFCGTLQLSNYSEQSSLCNDERDAAEWHLGRSEILQKKHVTRKSTGSYEGEEETSMTDVFFQQKKKNGETGMENLQQLREENSLLRKQVKELTRRSETDSRRIKHLTEELHTKSLQEEREAQDLEAMVQSVEQNLQLMTKRAVKAESSIAKLKQEMQQLHSQMEGVKNENERLRCGETTALTTMRHNAQVASEYLNKAAQDAENSIKQLLTGRETLYLVSQLLASIDKITQIHD